MPKLSFIFCSDTHLDQFTYPQMEELRGDTMAGFQQFVNKLLKYKCHGVITGDVFECNPRDYPQPATVAQASDCFQQLEDAGLKIYYVYGQHDRSAYCNVMYDVGWPQAINSKVAIPLTHVPVTVGGLDLIGVHSQFSHALPDVFAKAGEFVERPNKTVLACHQRWKELLKFDGAEEGTLADVPSVFDVIITGDLHAAKVLRQRRKGQSDRFVISPGALCRRKKREPDNHYIWYMYDNRTFKKQRVHSRPVARLVVNDVHDLDDLAIGRDRILRRLMAKGEKVPAEIAKPIVYIDGAGGRELIDRAADIFKDFCHVRTSARSEGVTIEGAEQPLYKERLVKTSRLVEEVTNSEDVIKFVKQGLNASDMEQYVKDWRRKRGL